MLRIVLSLLVIISLQGTEAALPACAERPTMLELPRVDSAKYCLEQVIASESLEEIAYTALAVSPENVLYAAKPLSGQIFTIEDTDGDLLPDTPRLIAEGLTLPNALVYHEDALYIAGGSHLYRWTPEQLEILVDDLPTGTGFWTGGVAVGEDNRIYVGIGSACGTARDICSSDSERGVILSFDKDGEDKRILASGLQNPAGLIWDNGGLWITDTAREGLDSGSNDELNWLDLDSLPGDFGFPDCIGGDNQADSEGVSCENVTAPALVFPTGSHPISLAVYQGEAFPALEGSLLIALSGTANQSRIRGYSLSAAQLDEPETIETILPFLDSPNLNFEGLGVYPHHLYGVAVSPQGWIYISTGGGKIYALRPV